MVFFTLSKIYLILHNVNINLTINLYEKNNYTKRILTII